MIFQFAWVMSSVANFNGFNLIMSVVLIEIYIVFAN